MILEAEEKGPGVMLSGKGWKGLEGRSMVVM